MSTILAPISMTYLQLLNQLSAQAQLTTEKLYVGEGTVRFHVGNGLCKLGLEDRTQAALYALRVGLVSLAYLGPVDYRGRLSDARLYHLSRLWPRFLF